MVLVMFLFIALWRHKGSGNDFFRRVYYIIYYRIKQQQQ